MAKALFHKSQRVFVKPVGTWALVEKVIPHWVKDVEEPLRVTYCVGLGRDFTGAELVSEDVMHGRDKMKTDHENAADDWRIQRVKNRWQEGDDTSGHPYPGTFPVVMTDENDWGGWRVPGSEYDRDPHKIEHQARLIVNSPKMLKVCRAIAELAAQSPDSVPQELKPAVSHCKLILRHVYDIADAPRQAAE
ncbi:MULTISPECIES: hypothetical protein [Henriciella]|jgi:hypothetical protein|uniref:Uncharacterized protein n=1 Tax=Henriciella pelagia TaxID=1977912 RepID=A0ABQ1J1W1_9PROT|nr:hypothetical protein [Henriciella pelagia]GGB57989.1 hypothetical protein GCM10011503_02990 [Henriciella pelagia]